jgi:hypothetical protein
MIRAIALMLQALLPSARRRCRNWLRTPSLYGAVCLLLSVFAVPPHGLAQYPGVDNDLTAGSMTSVDAATPAESSPADASSGDGGATTATSDAVSDSRQPAGDTGQDVESSRQAGALSGPSRAADRQRRQRYFIEKLRFEFAERDIIERRTGRPASWDRAAVYLRDIAAELQADQRIVAPPTIRGIGHDLAVIETMLDAKIDTLLVSIGETPAPRPWYQLPPPPVGSRVAAAQKLDALTQKSELLDFAAKVLAVMPNR